MATTSRDVLQERRIRYLRRAKEATRRAAAAESAELRKAYLMLSESWLALVQDIDGQLRG